MKIDRTQVSTALRVATRILCVSMVAGCGNKAPEDTKESLARDPERLKVVRDQCRDNPKSAEDRLCLAAAQAARERFFDRQAVDPNTTPPKPPTDPKSATPKF